MKTLSFFLFLFLICDNLCAENNTLLPNELNKPEVDIVIMRDNQGNVTQFDDGCNSVTFMQEDGNGHWHVAGGWSPCTGTSMPVPCNC